ncbi:hypothetical protein E4U41_003295 [Claviceps citrina]|nr:hypothetical protein E4U41_003295 [Claviceps citrina]
MKLCTATALLFVVGALAAPTVPKSPAVSNSTVVAQKPALTDNLYFKKPTFPEKEWKCRAAGDTMAHLAILLAGLLAAPTAAVAAATTTTATATATATTTLKIFFLGLDKMPLAGSVIAADAAAVTLALECAPDTASDVCGLPRGGLTVTQGPKTWRVEVKLPMETGTAVISQEANCLIDPAADRATCTAAVPSGASYETVQTVVPGFASMMVPVAITAGAEKLVATKTSGGASAGAAHTAASGTVSASGTAGNAAGPMVTQNPVVAGVAAVVAVVAGVLAL